MSILVAYIPTPKGEAALDAAIERAVQFGTSLHLVNVVRDSVESDPRHASTEQLAFAVRTARRAGVRDVDSRTRHIDDGDEVAHAIITEIEKTGADTLVLGARFGGTDDPRYLGNTIQTVIADSPADVLIV